MAADSQMVFGMCPYDDLVQMAHRISRFQAKASGMRFNEYSDGLDDDGERDDGEGGDDENAFETQRGNPDVTLCAIETDVGLESIQTYFRAEAF